ncbi:CIR protein [Plasmodium chabaudi chabaudi]|uniref:CIR protein n=1 Tax=Plasmodium chabaudi chabaudi TaxID=31271 RepID=A0A4V0JZR7_PLACU|nr:CIR protein [Plasmodium chabaudi chabaudi]VTZ66183.1 CIR protein [Plasmodium chabaudi chabaudi]|eukprot:XP_016652957.1 CIR protein [Plasmodium chabaudi chabaudi]
MAGKACKLLRDVDAYFNNGIVDENKFNSSGSFIYKCPYENRKPRGCKNNNERINALGGDLYDKLARIANDFKGEGDNGNRHIEIFMMWLSDKLYKLEKNKGVTLEESYKNYLDAHTGNFKYWNIVDSKRVYKKANVWYMSELYGLLKYICDLVNEYNKKPNKEKIEGISRKCQQKFTSIYKDIKDCYSYFHLLKFLKNIYDGIRNDAIKKDTNTKTAIRKAAARKAAIISDQIKKLKIKPPVTSSSQLLGYILNTPTISLIDLTPSNWDKRFSDDSDKIVDFHTQACINLYSEFVQKVKKDTPKNILEGQPQLGSNQSEKEGNQNPSNKQPETLPQPPIPAPQIQPQPPSQNDTSSKKSQKGTPGDGSSDSPSSTSEGSFNFESSFFEFLLNGMEIYNKASKFIEDNHQKFKDARDKISDTYNNTMINLKNVYDKSSGYFNDIISNIIDQLNQVDHSPKPGNSGNSMPQNIDKSQKGGDPPQLPSKGSPVKDPPPNPKLDPSLSKHLSPQSQSTTLQNPQTSPSNQKIFGQFPKSLSSGCNLKKKWNILLTTWNGSVECKPEVNFMNVTLACCTSDHCSLTGVSVTVVLIPIFLLVAYKFLSREWTKKSEKKSMKRVINLADGNRKTQIIIKSYDRNKDLKPVINSVSRKKYPLLNIYKLMQADPVPFINLFFLLIFFVYKENMIL